LYANIYVYDYDDVKYYIYVSYDEFIKTVEHVLKYYGKDIRIIKKVFDKGKMNNKDTNFFLIDINDDYEYTVNDNHYIGKKQKGGSKNIEHLFKHVNCCIKRCTGK
jgi:hypothetical protein